MGLFGLFCKPLDNALTKKIEAELWQKAVDELSSRGDGQVLSGLSKMSRDAPAELKGMYNSWLSEERQQLKMAIGEYHKIISDMVLKALQKAISQSRTEWYSIEDGSAELPVILAVPYAVLLQKTIATLVLLLE